MSFKNITVAGGGVLGSQIAFQTAFSGFSVKIWLRSEDSIQRTKPKLERLYTIYKNELTEAKKNLGKGLSFSRGLIPDSSSVTKRSSLPPISPLPAKTQISLSKAWRKIPRQRGNSIKLSILSFRKIPSSPQILPAWCPASLETASPDRKTIWLSILPTISGRVIPQKSWDMTAPPRRLMRR